MHTFGSGPGGGGGGGAQASVPTSSPSHVSEADRLDGVEMEVDELLLTPWRRLGQYPLLLSFIYEASLPPPSLSRGHSDWTPYQSFTPELTPAPSPGHSRSNSVTALPALADIAAKARAAEDASRSAVAARGEVEQEGWDDVASYRRFLCAERIAPVPGMPSMAPSEPAATRGDAGAEAASGEGGGGGSGEGGGEGAWVVMHDLQRCVDGIFFRVQRASKLQALLSPRSNSSRSPPPGRRSPVRRSKRGPSTTGRSTASSSIW